MRESILIRHVGPLHEVHIDEIKPITLLIGASASGKSTLLKVLVCMRYVYKMLNIRAYLRYADISKSPFRIRTEGLFSEDLKTALSSQSFIEYRVTIGERVYSIRYDGSVKKQKLTFSKDFDSTDLCFFKESFIAETRNLIPQWQDKGSLIRGKALDFYFQETYDDFAAATDLIREQPLRYIGYTLNVQRVGKVKQLTITPVDDSHRPIKLKHASSGLQTSASLMTIVRYFAREFSFSEAFRRSVLSYIFDNSELLMKFLPTIEFGDMRKYVHIHIEEPELSLYPEAQRRLLNEVVQEVIEPRAGDSRKLSVMIATHSPYILNQLNVLLETGYAHPDNTPNPALSERDVAAYFLDNGRLTTLLATDDETGHTLVDTYHLSETMEAISNDYFALRGGGR